MSIRTLCGVASLLAVWHVSAWAAGFVVNDLADGVDVSPGNGVCETARGTCTLRAAVQETNALPGADQITLAVGVHELTIAGANEDQAATGDLDITDDLTIVGVNAFLSIVDGNGIDRVLDQHAEPDVPLNLTLRDLTITGGDTNDTGKGGGLQFSRSVDAERIIVTGNNAGFSAGGGLYGRGSAFDKPAPALDLRFSIVSLNTALSGGGIMADSGTGTISIQSSIIIANTASWAGGGAFLSVAHGEVAELRRVTVYGNNAHGLEFPFGGGIQSTGNLTVAQSWVGHNLMGVWGAASPTEFGFGGGMHLSGVGNAIVNTTLEGNLAARGGALSASGAVTITHATIARNGAEPGGGAMHHPGSDQVDPASDQVDIRNTILAENLPVNCDGTVAFVSLGHNLDDDGSCGLAAAGDLVANAQLGALGNHGGPTRNILPLAGSPAIDGGTNANILFDQRGVTRPQLAQFDIGAVEVNPFDPERLPGDFLPGDSNARPHNCDLDRNGRVDFADLDRLIASFPVAGGHFRGDADRRLKTCVASCTHAGCPPVPLIHRRRWP